MKAEELREMPDAELRRKIDENREELFNLRFQIATRKMKNHQRISEVKKEIARMMTALRERELIRQYTGEEYAPSGETTGMVATSEARSRRRLFGRGR